MKSIKQRPMRHHFRVHSGKPLDLHKSSTECAPYYKDDSDYDHQLSELTSKVSKHQDLLFADRRYGVLLIFQGMDAAGKDGSIKHVMSHLNPQGVTVHSFGPPSSEELQHDFLWRTHQVIPERGKFGVFNRSYYEEVLTVRVHQELLDAERIPKENLGSDLWRDRLRDIAEHEAYLYRQGYRILKFFLHISKSEQKKRLRDRLDEPWKNWKIGPGDVEERAYWKRYQKFYAEAMKATSRDEAPWYVVPGDDKKNARLLISKILLETMQELPLKYPEITASRKRELKEIRRVLK